MAFQRAAIAARLENGLLARGWSGEADRLWRLSEALAAFEAIHIRPLIDEATEEALLAAYAPGTGSIAAGPDARTPTALPQALGPQSLDSDDPGADESRATRCGSFADTFALRRVLG